MGKYEEYLKTITEALNGLKLAEVAEHLKLNSKLPGPRVNLELASAFADYFYNWTGDDKLFEFLLELANIDDENTPADDPREMLPFCTV